MRTTSLYIIVELMTDSHPGNRGEIRTTEVFTPRDNSLNAQLPLQVAGADRVDFCIT